MTAVVMAKVAATDVANSRRRSRANQPVALMAGVALRADVAGSSVDLARVRRRRSPMPNRNRKASRKHASIDPIAAGDPMALPVPMAFDGRADGIVERKPAWVPGARRRIVVSGIGEMRSMANAPVGASIGAAGTTAIRV